MFEASAEIGDKDRYLIFRRIDWSEKMRVVIGPGTLGVLIWFASHYSSVDRYSASRIRKGVWPDYISTAVRCSGVWSPIYCGN